MSNVTLKELYKLANNSIYYTITTRLTFYEKWAISWLLY